MKETKLYSILKVTNRAQIEYYVKIDFKKEYETILNEVENEVEHSYVNIMHNTCLKAMNLRGFINYKLNYNHNTKYEKEELINQRDNIDYSSCTEYDRVLKLIKSHL